MRLPPPHRRPVVPLGIVITMIVGLAAGCGSAPESGPPTTTTASTTTASQPVTTAAETTASTATPLVVDDDDDTVLTVRSVGDVEAASMVVALAVESRVDDVPTDQLSTTVFEVLNRPEGWIRAGFRFEPDPDSDLRLILAEGPEVDELCLPLETYAKVSCQNGPVVALNADRWRNALDGWDSTVEDYRLYLINHEVGHLIGQRHPAERCPNPGRPAGLMEPQTAGLQGCSGNGWPRDWEVVYASERPVKIGPLPSWQPPRKANLEGR